MAGPLRWIAIPLAGILLVLFFVYRGFPYDRLGLTLAPRASGALGARIQIQKLGPWLSLGGPGLEARGVNALFDDGRRLRLERVAGRPAWSASWLRGRPALWMELDGPDGSAEGTWFVGIGWRGELRGVEMALLPAGAIWPGVSHDGKLDARIDLRLTELGPEGEVSFEVKKGSLRVPGSPVALPYEQSRGELALGGESFLELLDFSLEGPMLSATGKGRIARAPHFAQAPLQLEFQVRKSASPVNRLLRSAGVRLSRGGAGRVRIQGTPGAPQLR